MENASRYQKLFISMRYWLIGMSQHDKNYLIALNALEYAKNIHIGFRKDGITPEFQHQLEIAHYLRTLAPGLLFPAQTLAAAFLHDVPEDYEISFEEIEKKFGYQVMKSVDLVTKKYKGVKKDNIILFEDMAKDPISSVLKGADRINNHQSMNGVFGLEKQLSYIAETQDFIIPMLKKARHLHVQQEQVYENIKFVLNSQMSFVKTICKDCV